MERSEIRGRCTRRCCGRPRITLVESRGCARALAQQRRPVSHPRSSNRTCPFQSSGFPTGFIVDSQTHAHRPLESHHPHGTEHPFLRELAGALRRHLVTPPQKVPHCVIDMLVNRPVSLARRTTAEVCSPAFQYLIQPLTHLFPWLHVARHQQLSHFRLDPGHALLRRTVPEILPPRSRTVVRSECVSQKIESLLTGVPDTRLLLVESQLQPLQHPARPVQCLRRFPATENHKIVRVVHHVRPKLLSPPALPPALQHPVHVQVGEHRTDHPALRGTAIIILAARQPPLPVSIPLFDRHFQPHLDQMQHVPIDDSPSHTL